MAEKGQPSYTELVYEALRSAEHPLAFQEILNEVNRRRPSTTRDPKATIRNALSQGWQLISLGDGRFGYLPYLVNGSLLRLPLTEKKPANHPLSYPTEVLQALWPSFHEIQKRRVIPSVEAHLPNDDVVSMSIQFLGNGVWGSLMTEGLRRYLIRNGAAEGDSLMVRVTDAELCNCEMWFESRWKRDHGAIVSRNQELADAAYQVLRKSQSREMFNSSLAVALLGRGVYHSDIAPAALETVLKDDSRFVDAGLGGWMLADAITPEIQDYIDDRLRMTTEFSQFLREAEMDVSGSPPVPTFRRGMERSLADLEAAISDGDFDSEEEAREFLENVLATGDIPRRQPSTPLDRAQELIYDAWEASSSRERIRLARKALQISPDCADAYVILAEESAKSIEEEADFYEKGVAAGERALGIETFERDVGYFWGIVSTRPYMRARSGLAEALWEMERYQEAVEHLWDMLRLNPSDNQGVRYLLLCWLLELQDDAQVKRLLGLFPGDGMAVWMYGSALFAFQTEGDTVRSRKLLADAIKQNRFVPAYLTGIKQLPSALSDTMGIGDESEAVACAVDQIIAWLKTPGAVVWLAKHTK